MLLCSAKVGCARSNKITVNIENADGEDIRIIQTDFQISGEYSNVAVEWCSFYPENHGCTHAATKAIREAHDLSSVLANNSWDPTRCESQKPVQLTVWHRVPKSGSLAILNAVSDAKNTTMGLPHAKLAIREILDPDRGYYLFNGVNEKGREQMAHFVNTQVLGSPMPVLAHSHLYWMGSTWTQAVTRRYISIVRHPVDRCISVFRWESEISGHGKIGSLSLKDCLASGCLATQPIDEFPVSPSSGSETHVMQRIRLGCNNFLVRFFCGFDKECMLPSDVALTQAVENMNQRFSFVGIFEHMDTTLALLEGMFPDAFAGAPAAFKAHEEGNVEKRVNKPYYYYSPKFGLQNRNQANHDRQADMHDVNKITDINQFDVKLYTAIYKHFIWLAGTCMSQGGIPEVPLVVTQDV